jgi:hypothetical protein
MTELEALAKARDLYLDWTGIPKPRDSYPGCFINMGDD